MKRLLACLLPVLLGVTTAACDDPPDAMTTLRPGPNPMTPSDPLWTPQPLRDRPRTLCVSQDGTKAWVMLPGVEDAPGEDVAIVDLQAEKVQKRVRLGRSPWSCALDPTGRWLLVTLRYSDRLVVLDAKTDQVIERVPVPWYTETALWTPDGKRVYLANRWKDSVLWWDMATEVFRVERKSYEGLAPEEPMGTPVGENPGPMVLSSDGSKLFVGAVAGCTLAVLDAKTGQLIDVDGDPATTTVGAPKGVNHFDFHSPVGGLAVHGPYLYVADTGAGLGAQPHEGIDIDEDGKPGDGTANQAFQDQQNEIGILDTRTLTPVDRITADSICCKDFRDVDPDHPDKGLKLPEADQWSPDVVATMPPKDKWLVAGALPEALLVRDDTLWVAYAGSNEVQGFAIGAGGGLTPLQAAGGLYRTGYNPKALARGPGSRIVTVDKLGESLTIIDPSQPPGKEKRIVVGNVSGGPFPATDAELGEGINEMTAVFSIDGDQTCVQCHRDNGAIARPMVMPLQSSRAWSLRNVMAQRGLFDTRPWFFESAMNEDNFFPVLNEFARRENFCCEGLDMMVWGKYPKVDACLKDKTLAGCNHVLNCLADPPPECATRPYAQTPFLKRSDFIKDAAKRLFGRDKTFGDALYKVDVKGAKQPIPLDFDGITKALGLFMMRTPRLLPNPNAHLNLPTAARGKILYEDPQVGCAKCHPLPNTTTTSLPDPFSPFGMPVRFPPVISPERRPDGTDAMKVNEVFIATFPLTVQTAAGLHVGATPLRGIWDRPQTRIYHDGRGRSLREALATPGHAILRAGEVGRNERDGQFNTHGGTSQLSKYQLQDLINFMLTL